MLKIAQGLYYNTRTLPHLSYIYVNFSNVSVNQPSIQHYECSSNTTLDLALNDMKVIESFVSIDEEEKLLKDIEQRFKRLKYQKGHWDNVRFF